MQNLIRAYRGGLCGLDEGDSGASMAAILQPVELACNNFQGT